MEFVFFDPNSGEFLIGDFDPGWVCIPIPLGLDRPTRLCFGTADKINHDRPTHEWFATPVLGDVTEHAMLDLVPFAGARWKVAHGDA